MIHFSLREYVEFFFLSAITYIFDSILQSILQRVKSDAGHYSCEEILNPQEKIMDLYLKGKTAVVTGASQGLRRAMTKELAIEGVTVFAIGRNEALLNSLKDEIVAAGSVGPIVFVQDFV